MKKIFKRKNPEIPQRDEQDMSFLINKIQEQLGSLERKIDLLIGQSSAKPFQRLTILAEKIEKIGTIASEKEVLPE